ncbi:unnamed protein product [Rotaria sp. Silwood1]|nr:unnamed protein product [Rotaria sp. Silwood1]CAF3498661.1 unnamed protein product [Rotaria sp. Silwood1]CAF4941655.1 unnamed protein product [Rotaria sp. Silwood1]
MNGNIDIDPSLLIDCNINKFKNPINISTFYDDDILIWLDKCIHNDEQDDQYSIYQLRRLMNSFLIFTNEKEFISGSLGKDFVPVLNCLSQINSIYVFCGKKIDHEYWAKNYEKVKGVFNDIKDLCVNLIYNKQKCESNQSTIEHLIDLSSKKSSLPYECNEIINLKNSECNNYQPDDDMQISTASADIPFSNKENCSSINEIEIVNNVESSQSVTPFIQYKQQMEFSDNGIWPCLFVVDRVHNALFNHLNSVLGSVKFSHSMENCLEHVCYHRDDPHLIIICDLTNIEYLPILIRSNVRNIYIYCPNKSLDDYSVWTEKHPNVICALQHTESLTRLIIWDLSACIVSIGNYYDNENQKNLAQTRYRYAYRLHIIFRENLNNRLQMFEIIDQ